MKRVDLIREIADAAREKGVTWRFGRHGSDHDIWYCSAIRVPIPRHREVSEGVVDRIRRDLEAVLGTRWWM